jgi:hypothetical protein
MGFSSRPTPSSAINVGRDFQAGGIFSPRDGSLVSGMLVKILTFGDAFATVAQAEFRTNVE